MPIALTPLSWFAEQTTTGQRVVHRAGRQALDIGLLERAIAARLCELRAYAAFWRRVWGLSMDAGLGCRREGAAAPIVKLNLPVFDAVFLGASGKRSRNFSRLGELLGHVPRSYTSPWDVTSLDTIRTEPLIPLHAACDTLEAIV